MTTLSKPQCHHIMAPILQHGLPKVGVVCSFPRALAHSPLEYGSLDIPQIFTEQLIMHVLTILRYGADKTDPTGLLLHATGEAMHLEVGHNGELLAAPLVLSENVTTSWIKHVWISMQEAEVTVSTDFMEVPPQQHGDMELM